MRFRPPRNRSGWSGYHRTNLLATNTCLLLWRACVPAISCTGCRKGYDSTGPIKTTSGGSAVLPAMLSLLISFLFCVCVSLSLSIYLCVCVFLSVCLSFSLTFCLCLCVFSALIGAGLSQTTFGLRLKHFSRFRNSQDRSVLQHPVTLLSADRL